MAALPRKPPNSHAPRSVRLVPIPNIGPAFSGVTLARVAGKTLWIASGNLAMFFRERGALLATEEKNHEGLVSHRSAVRSRDLRNDPDLSASNAAWRGVERRSSTSCHVSACPGDGAPGRET